VTAAGERSADPPARPRLILVIHNPVAGQRRRQRFWDVLDLLERDGSELSLHLTEAPGHAAEFARRIRPGEVDLVIAAGGDGTINEVVNGLVAGERPPPTPLAILPLGTSNVLAAEIGLARSPAAVARTIRDGATVRISLGHIIGDGADLANGCHFILMAGAGLDGRAVAGVDDRLKRHFAQGAYVWAGLREIFNAKRRRYAVEIDGAHHEAAWVVVAKARRYGGPFVMAARARLDDPRFEVCLFAEAGMWPLARYGWALARGRLAGTPGFTSVLGRRVRIAAAPSETDIHPAEEPLQADGDDMARLPVAIEVVPDALDLVVPRDGPYG
jgi:diacylglycerol kinase (ATP)